MNQVNNLEPVIEDHGIYILFGTLLFDDRRPHIVHNLFITFPDCNHINVRFRHSVMIIKIQIERSR